MHGPTSYRAGVGIVLLNKEGLVFAGHRKDRRQPPWQMPQGGMEPGESPYRAALRELAEETGTRQAAVIDIRPSWLRYDYPSQTATHRAAMYRGQQHKWFLMAFLGQDHEIDLAAHHAEFSEWRWMHPEELIERVISFKREVYREVFRSFAGTIRARQPRCAHMPTSYAPAMAQWR